MASYRRKLSRWEEERAGLVSGAPPASSYLNTPSGQVSGLTTPQIEKYRSKFEEYGLPTPQPAKEEPSLLKKIFGLLQRGETAPAVHKYMETGDIGEAIGEYGRSTFGAEPMENRITYENILEDMGWKPTDPIEKAARWVAGTALDIVLDPKTWITFGGDKVLSKTGQDFLEKSTGEIAESMAKTGLKVGQNLGEEAGEKFASQIPEMAADAAQRKLMMKATQEGGENFFVKPGMKFMGQQIIDRKTLMGPIKGFEKVIEKTPVLGQAYKAVGEVYTKAFKPFGDLLKMPMRGDEAADLFKFYPKKMRFEQAARIEKIEPFFEKIKNLPGNVAEEGLQKASKKIASKMLDQSPELAGRKMTKEMLEGSVRSQLEQKFAEKTFRELKQKPLTHALSEVYEKGVRTGIKDIDDVLNVVEASMKKIGTEEVGEGVLKKQISSPYLRHIMTPDAKKAIFEGKDIFKDMPTTWREAIQKGATGLDKKLGEVLDDILQPAGRATKKFKLGKDAPRKLYGTIADINKWSDKSLGMKMFEEDIFKNWAVREVENVKKLGQLGMVKNVADRFGAEAPGKIAETTGKFVKDGMEYTKSAIPLLQNKWLPKPIVEHLDEFNKVINNDEAANAFLKTYDKMIRVWKGTVTGIWPAFHTRNFIGGSWNNFLAGVKAGDYLDAERVLKGKDIKIGKYTGDQIKELASKYGAAGQPGMIDIWRETSELVGKGKISKKILDYPAFVMEKVEDRLRMPLFVNSLKKGISPQDAAKKVLAYHFDYAPEGLTVFERNVMKRLMPFYCVSEDTECLTKEGWKTHDQLKIGEEILSYNLDNKSFEWKPTQGVFSAPFNHKLLHFVGKSIDLLCTFDHRCITENGLKQAYKISQKDKVAMKIDYKKEDYNISDKILKLIFWIITDGYSRMKNNYLEAVIYQKKEPHLTEIKELVGRDGSVFVHPETKTSCVRINGKTRKEITKHFSSKNDIWKLICELSPRQLKLAQETMMKAEGCCSYKDTSRQFQLFAQNKGVVLDVFQLVTILSGTISNLAKRGLYLRNKPFVKYPKPEVVDYNGIIWCPKTENKTWVARRNGRVIITGNTWFRNNAPLQIKELAKQPGKFAAVAKIERNWMNAVPGAKEELKYEPNWMKDMLLFKIPSKEKSFYLQLDLPIDDLSKLPVSKDGRREIFSLLSPALKYPIEVIANKNIYFGTDIWDKDMEEYPEFQTSKATEAISKLPEPIKNWLGYKEGVRKNYKTEEYEPYFEMDSKKLHAMRSFVGRFYSTIDQMSDDDMPWWGKAARQLMGTPVRDFDIDDEKYRRIKAYERVLREAQTFYKQRKMIPYASEEDTFNRETY